VVRWEGCDGRDAFGVGVLGVGERFVVEVGLDGGDAGGAALDVETGWTVHVELRVWSDGRG
jgi:hypothetical protein